MPSDVVNAGPFVAGGDSLVRRVGEKTLFVEGALPDEEVRVEVTESRKDLERGRVVEVVAASRHRIDPPCPVFRRGCGGCQWQHLDEPGHADAKVEIVEDALRRIAKQSDIAVRFAGAVPAFGYRTTLRVAIDDTGRAALRRRHSHDLVTLDTCLIAHPLLHELVTDGRYRNAEEVTLRAGVATGERLVLTPKGADVDVPDGVIVTHRRGAIHEDVLGRRYQVSARSFFQSGPAAAELLTETVDALVPADIDWVVDAYSGVGVLGATVADRRNATLTAIEQDRTAAADARTNLADLDAQVIEAEVATVQLSAGHSPDVVIADPARSGLGKSASATLAGLGAETLVLVSCDPASLARDVLLLAGHDYAVREIAVLDLFPQTHHVETVTVFTR